MWIMKAFPDVCFEAECECYDNWVSEESQCSYDGEEFECDAEWADFEEFEFEPFEVDEDDEFEFDEEE